MARKGWPGMIIIALIIFLLILTDIIVCLSQQLLLIVNVLPSLDQGIFVYQAIARFRLSDLCRPHFLS